MHPRPPLPSPIPPHRTPTPAEGAQSCTLDRHNTLRASAGIGDFWLKCWSFGGFEKWIYTGGIKFFTRGDFQDRRHRRRGHNERTTERSTKAAHERAAWGFRFATIRTAEPSVPKGRRRFGRQSSFGNRAVPPPIRLSNRFEDRTVPPEPRCHPDLGDPAEWRNRRKPTAAESSESADSTG